jgi:type I restriction enzyme S subunit
VKSNFPIVKLSQISKIYSGNSINEKVKKERFSNIDLGVDYISTKDIGFDSLINYNNGIKIPKHELRKFKTAPENTVFICAEGGSAGKKIAISDRELCFVNKLFAVVANNQVIPKFIFYSLQTTYFINQFKSAMTGIIGGVSLQKFKELEIELPSLEIQKEIVEKLDVAFAEIDKSLSCVDLNYKNTEALFKSYLNEVFVLNKGMSWIEDNLEALCEKDRGITYGVIKLGDHTNDGIPCLRTSNVKWLAIDTHDMKIISRNLSNEYSRTILQGNEVLVNVRGTLGGVCVVDKSMEGWNISREVAMLPLDNQIINSYFVGYFIASNASQSWLSSVKKGAAYVGINLEDLRRLKIAYPKLENQNEIVNKIKKFESNVLNLKKLYKAKFSELELLKQSMLDNLSNFKDSRENHE